jgi:hypothetical protein
LGIALRLADDGYDVAANGQTSTKELDDVVKKIEEKGRRALANREMFRRNLLSGT